MNELYKTLPVQLPDGRHIHAELKLLGGEEEIAPKLLSFEGISESISSLAQGLQASLSDLKPSKIKLEFGVQLSIESGQLTAVLVKSTGEGSLKIALEWEIK